MLGEGWIFMVNGGCFFCFVSGFFVFLFYLFVGGVWKVGVWFFGLSVVLCVFFLVVCVVFVDV